MGISNRHRPLKLDILTEDEIPLTMVARPVTSEMKSRFDARAEAELKKRREAGEGGDIKSYFTDLMDQIGGTLQHDIPILMQDDDVNADDMYDYLLHTWQRATPAKDVPLDWMKRIVSTPSTPPELSQDEWMSLAKKLNLETENAYPDEIWRTLVERMTNNKGFNLSIQTFKKFKDTLDGIRAGWKRDPEVATYIDKKSGQVVGPQTEEEALTVDKIYHHKFGSGHYNSEKEELAGFPYLWYVAGDVGSASTIDQQIIKSRGGTVTLPWQFKQADTGGTAKGMDWERTKQLKDQQTKLRMLRKGGVPDAPGMSSGHGAELPKLTVMGKGGKEVTMGGLSPTAKHGVRGTNYPAGSPESGITKGSKPDAITDKGFPTNRGTTGKFTAGDLIDYPKKKRPRGSDSASHNEGISIDDIANCITEDIDDTWAYFRGDLIEGAEGAAAAAPPAPPAAPAAAPAPAAGAQPPAAKPGAQPQQPDPAIEKAKQEGGKLVDSLSKQLQILMKASDWAKIKADLVGKLKPFLG